MSNKIFTKKEIEILSKNKYVKTISSKAITYTSEFRRIFIAESQDKILPRAIFEKYGFDVQVLGMKRIRSAAARWRRAYKEQGVLGLDDRRKENSGRPLERELSLEEKYERLQVKNDYLQAEIDLLKKLDVREREVNGKLIELSPSEKFVIIKDVIETSGVKNIIKYLCEVAEISRTSYYNYLSETSKTNKSNQELEDEKARDLIIKAYEFKGRQKGARQIKMTLENEFATIFNLKKIRRIMKKYSIVCTIRKANPYKRIAKATKEHTTIPNKLNREFKQEIPGKILLTDITYLSYGNGQRAYLSTIKDSSTGEIPAYVLSKNIKLEIATETIRTLMENKSFKIHKDALIHSDQGVHYTSPTFQKLVKNSGLDQSMSRRGNCWDNAPQESFFGHFKDEANIKECNTFEELINEIDDYMDYYNNYRCQWGLKKMTPIKYRNHLLENKSA
ncbi:IS3 family transposase [Haliovirga abyssi]|uniref:Integrase catalytic domain-containing protein n=1 Tax=Haliovirga abyssi TaxID=2996794 RepID=A0AAU9DE42_9FUSO|nr:IS3 family transposase [Haliovirga abyssi]BDU50469.1 hypothetical protein HLVA_10380 [Haliovirga abyssi]BDU50831.1 hypothetical protein HLVA_14000 [Haliovirga abyssi]BDU51276.1 hypothetical protein HLVA_18450 [Haliovirga abyssi]BDU51303.1 hypothetical protein HLVA_18720 [Haliovirga abyssi]BDU51422.1 hypothetical protein HLVA_19910 [Haliovirga abyssi]